MHTLMMDTDGAGPDLVRKRKGDLSNINSISIRKYNRYNKSGPSRTAVLAGLTPQEHGIKTIQTSSRLTPFLDRALRGIVKEKRVGLPGGSLTCPLNEGAELKNDAFRTSVNTKEPSLTNCSKYHPPFMIVSNNSLC